MKKTISLIAILFIISSLTFAQQHEKKEHVLVPSAVKKALHKKYPEAKKVTWEKENGNYEANWGGNGGEDNSAQFTPEGSFIEIVKAIPLNQLPEGIIIYVNSHYKGTKITEAGKVTDAKGNLFYEAEIKGRGIIFDKTGKFVKAE